MQPRPLRPESRARFQPAHRKHTGSPKWRPFLFATKGNGRERQNMMRYTCRIFLVLITACGALAQRTAFNVGGRTVASQYGLWEARSTTPVPIGTAAMIVDRCVVNAGLEEGKNF